MASFNYAWKLVELPLVLAIQLVASLAFPAVTRTAPDSAERTQALQMAFVLAWALGCAAVAAVATFALPMTQLLFGWGHMQSSSQVVIAQWSAIGVWSLLPQALIAVLLTLMATRQQMHVAVWTYAAGALAFNQVFPAAFPDLHFEIQQTLVDGDTVVVLAEGTGTFTKPLATPQGVLPTVAKAPSRSSLSPPFRTARSPRSTPSGIGWGCFSS